jgi:hypothetical protein
MTTQENLQQNGQKQQHNIPLPLPTGILLLK